MNQISLNRLLHCRERKGLGGYTQGNLENAEKIGKQKMFNKSQKAIKLSLKTIKLNEPLKLKTNKPLDS